ncbi:MAG: peptidase M1 [Melioribacteraceae bacterium]|nr:MAG: peptidase M1 [Melioribacteraceae bacterium]
MWGPDLSRYQSLYDSGDIVSAGKAYREMQMETINSYLDSVQYNINILKYNLSVELFPEKKNISVAAVISGELLNAKKENIVFNFRDNFSIDSLKLDHVPSAFKYEDEYLIVPFGKESDSFLVEVYYSGNPEASGFGSFEFGEIQDGKLIYSINEPTFASTWFPCNDRPDDKTQLEISITNDSNYVSASNGILMGIELNADRKTYHWKTDYPISTYLVTINSAPYVNFQEYYVGADSLLLDYYVLPGSYEDAKRDFKVNAKALECFEELFGDYPFYGEKYGVAEFLWDAGAMEHQTLTGVSFNLITGSGFFEDFFIHEVAHHWWGNSVGPKTWKDIWLNEGFSTYSEALYYEYYNGPAALASTMEGKKDSFEDTRLYPPDGFVFSRTFYDKGAWVLHMLRRETGDDIFFDMLKTIQRDYKYSNYSTPEFISLAEKLSGRSLSNFFKQWVTDGEGIIYIDYVETHSKENEEYLTELEILQDNITDRVYSFPLDVRYIYYDNQSEDFTYNISKKIQKIVFRGKNRVKKVILDPDTWLLAEINGMVEQSFN